MKLRTVFLAIAMFAAPCAAFAQQTFVGVRLKEIARAEGVQDNALIGYAARSAFRDRATRRATAPRCNR